MMSHTQFSRYHAAVEFPYGSIMVFESYATVNDDAGNQTTFDANGRFVRGALTTVLCQDFALISGRFTRLISGDEIDV